MTPSDSQMESKTCLHVAGPTSRCKSPVRGAKTVSEAEKTEARARIKREEEERGTLQTSTNGELVYRSTLPKLKGWGEGGDTIAYVP